MNIKDFTGRNSIPIVFLTSAVSEGKYSSTKEILKWIQNQNKCVHSDISQIPLNKLRGWKVSSDIICHETGRFFNIEGIKITTNYGNVASWSQPIINQPEIGFLGLITKKIDGILHFLIQAKIEPGNINTVQISPTLQATRISF